jgi:hypothetical protein
VDVGVGVKEDEQQEAEQPTSKSYVVALDYSTRLTTYANTLESSLLLHGFAEVYQPHGRANP